MKLLKTMPKEVLKMIKTVVFKTNENITDAGLSELNHLPNLETMGLMRSSLVTGSFLQKVDNRKKLTLTLVNCLKFNPKALLVKPLPKRVGVEKCLLFSNLNTETKQKLENSNIFIKD